MHVAPLRRHRREHKVQGDGSGLHAAGKLWTPIAAPRAGKEAHLKSTTSISAKNVALKKAVPQLILNAKFVDRKLAE